MMRRNSLSSEHFKKKLAAEPRRRGVKCRDLMHYNQCNFVTSLFTSLYYALKFRSDFSTFLLADSSFFF